ncbi:MAG: hypothetical protein ACRD47_09070 [Nitrososphaeraceae archaeon]|jgi:hypothetical protein
MNSDNYKQEQPLVKPYTNISENRSDVMQKSHMSEAKIVQRWNGIRPPINYLLRDYRIWLVSEKIDEKVENKRSALISELA